MPEVRLALFSFSSHLGQTFVWSVGFQGVYGFGLFGGVVKNFPTPIPDPLHAGFFYMPGTPNTAFGAIRTNNSDRNTAYNALVASAQKRLSRHLQFQGSYTWSKTTANRQDFHGLSEPANPLSTLGLDRSLAQNDIRHLGNFNVVIDTERLLGTPFLRNRSEERRVGKECRSRWSPYH